MSATIQPELIRTSDVCRLLSVSEWTLRRWVRLGKVPRPVRIGCRSVRWDRKEIIELVRSARSQNQDQGRDQDDGSA